MIKDSTIYAQIDGQRVNLSESLLSMKFHVSQRQNLNQQCQTYLYQNQLIFQVQSDSQSKFYQISFEYDLKCIIKEKHEFQDQNKELNQFCLFQFIKKEQKIKFLKYEEDQNFKAWRQILQRKLILLGFYDDYKPINMLGQGNFAKIFLIQNNHNNSYNAVKTFSKNYQFYKQNGRESFINQISIMRMFNHDNILKINEVYENDHSLFLCMQLHYGCNLMNKINEKAKFEAHEVKAIMKSLLTGIQQMHKKKIMHRDLKPQNILFRYFHSNQCVIADFGLAESSQKQQRLFNICGTPGYVAPQILKRQKYNQACDLFSIGVILHIILLGKAPFEAESLRQLYQKNLKCEIDFNDFQYHQLPETWRIFLKQLLEADPKKRLTASEALAHKFFQKQPLVKRKIKTKSIEQLLDQIDIENTINVEEFDELLKKKARINPKLLKKIQNYEFDLSRQSKNDSNYQSYQNSYKSGISVKSVNSSLKALKKTKHQQSKFRDLAFNNS